ncbi:hypothetical protein Acsp04_19030 [Actinomadura sp. NBRC 104425]|uniref:hypothetical protein n=1 Tax=Actinomadura sp. NBRC 104425 TaxID=3032204 RepID=UPI0024A275AE|nr:hypothetical protein [Actinomadura sp. NBRC 104425]GLZ11668.1 hypothetical protein Acsp04_19030 [Actinomadura sp. NBRC 104425]
MLPVDTHVEDRRVARSLLAQPVADLTGAFSDGGASVLAKKQARTGAGVGFLCV